MGLSPSEFWALTPHEFNLLAEAYKESREEEFKIQQYWVAQLMWAAGIPNWKKGTSPRAFMHQEKPKAEPDGELSPMQRAHQRWIDEQLKNSVNGNGIE